MLYTPLQSIEKGTAIQWVLTRLYINIVRNRRIILFYWLYSNSDYCNIKKEQNFVLLTQEGNKPVFLFRYSLGDIPTYCLKYFPKNDCVGKLSLVAISLILKSVLSSRYLASVMTFCIIHCKALLPDFSLMTEEKYRADKHCLSA